MPECIDQCLPAFTGQENRGATRRSEEHTCELQSLTNLVCRLLLEKKKKYGTHGKLFTRRIQRSRVQEVWSRKILGRRIIPEFLHPDILTGIDPFLIETSRYNRLTL